MLLSMPLEVVDVVLKAQKHPPLNWGREPLFLGLVNIVSLGAAIALGLVVNRLPLRRAFPLANVSPAAWAAMIFTGLGAATVLSEVDNLTRWVLPPPQWIVEMVADIFLVQDRTVSLLFTLVVVAPVTEELLFRGLILRGLLGRFHSWVALLLSAGLFSVMHMNPWQLIPTFALGLLFGWFYLRTGSLLPCIAGHALNNFMAFLVMHGCFGLWEPLTAADYSVVEFQPWWLTLGGAVLFVAGGWGFRASTKSTAVAWDEPRPPQGNRIPPPMSSPVPCPPVLAEVPPPQNHPQVE
jgi:membrane protease YdiL (CAAX protease family)